MTRSKSLLVEMLLAALFLALSATVILRLFLLAHTTARESTLTDRATAVAQNWAERLYAADEAEELLARNGFLAVDEGYQLETEDGLFVEISLENLETDQGLLMSAMISVGSGGEALVGIDRRRYVPGEAD